MIRDELKKIVSEFYFVHCKPEARPEFKTLEEAEAWNSTHIFAIDYLTEKTVDSILSLFKEYIDSRPDKESILKGLEDYEKDKDK